jgi:transmembrane sensor
MNRHEQQRNSPATAADWMARMGEGPLSPEQKAGLADWLRTSPTHVGEMLRMTLLRQDVAAARAPARQLDEWIRQARAISRDGLVETSLVETGPAQSGQPERDTTRHALRLAAGLAALACAFAWHAAFQHGRYTTGFGEQRIVTLQDGSVVSLNTDTTARVRFSDTRRVVELHGGEAFFRVARDAARPFEVTAREATVRALGTQFNVRIAPDATLVSVMEGLVEVRSPDNQTDRLGVGEEVRVPAPSAAAPSPAIVRTSRPSAQRASAWTRGRVEFDGTPLAQVLAEFQRYRQFEVSIEDAQLRELQLTGSFDAHDPQSALAYVDTLPGVSVQRRADNAFTIRRDDAPKQSTTN